MSRRIRVRFADGGWGVELPRFGFAAQSRIPFGSHSEALAYAVAEAERRRGPVSLYAGVSAESWGPWTLRVVRR